MRRCPSDWAAAQLNLGNVYSNLTEGNVRANVEQALACYLNALQVYTHEEFPVDWAMTQYNRGNAYTSLASEDAQRRENLERAIACYSAALRVFQSLHMENHAHITSETLQKTQESLNNL